MQPGPETSLLDPSDNTALVCVDHQHDQTLLVAHLTHMAYKVHLSPSAEDILLKLQTNSYNVVIVSENFKGATPQTNPILREIVQQPGSQRRQHFVVLLSDHLPTDDAMSAFAQSVDLTINNRDLANFKPVLRRGLAQHRELYQPLHDALKTAAVM